MKRWIHAGTGRGEYVRWYLIDYPDRTPIEDIDDGVKYSFATEEEALQFIEDNPYFKKKYPGIEPMRKRLYSVYHE